MIPTWLIIAVGLAVVVALLWRPLIVLAVLLFGVVCLVLGVLLTALDWALTKTGLYRWHNKRRVKKAKAAIERRRREFRR